MVQSTKRNELNGNYKIKINWKKENQKSAGNWKRSKNTFSRVSQTRFFPDHPERAHISAGDESISTYRR